MNLIQLIVVIVVLGICMYLINNFVPMQPPWKTVLNIVVVLVFVIWLLSAVGLLGPLSQPLTR
ncbi:MAG: Thivi_2564 family membrane protein [Burkholderiales bacterium]